MDAARHPQLPLDVAGLALLVDAGADHRGAVLAGQPEEPVEPGARRVAVLEVGRVEDRPPPSHCSAASMTGGSVESSTSGTLDCVAKRRRHLVHVGDAVGARVVDAHVEHVGALLHLVLAMATDVSQSPASMASRNSLDPLALVRSPMIRNDVSWWKGTKV